MLGLCARSVLNLHARTARNRPCEKQNEFGFIVSRRPYFLVVDNWERPFALPPSPFLANFRVADKPGLVAPCAFVKT